MHDGYVILTSAHRNLISDILSVMGFLFNFLVSINFIHFLLPFQNSQILFKAEFERFVIAGCSVICEGIMSNAYFILFFFYIFTDRKLFTGSIVTQLGLFLLFSQLEHMLQCLSLCFRNRVSLCVLQKLFS